MSRSRLVWSMVPGVLLACNLTSTADLGSMVPTWEGYQARLDALKGRPVNEVIDDWGPPDQVLDAAQGHKLFVWESKHTFTTPDRFAIQETEDGKGAVGVIDRGEEVGVSCTTTLRADTDGLVASVKAEGAGCLAPMPETGPAPVVPAPVPAAAPGVAAEPDSDKAAPALPTTDEDAATEEPTTEERAEDEAGSTGEVDPSLQKRLDSVNRRRRKQR